MEALMVEHSLDFTVTYPAAGKPFHDHHAARNETLGSVKPRVLTFFHLAEGQEGGSQITYVFFKGKERLTDLSITLGALAGHADALALKLVQQIEQGA
jgi:hypothetical protein